VRVIGTPRRQAALVYGLAPRQPDRTLEVQGPPAKVAFDPEGNLTRAGQGFAQKQGVPVEALRVVTDGDKVVRGGHQDRAGPARCLNVLAEELPGCSPGCASPDNALERDQRHLPAPAALAGGGCWSIQVVPFAYAGVSSGRTTRGLRRLARRNIELASAGSYLAAMAESPDRRRRDRAPAADQLPG